MLLVSREEGGLLLRIGGRILSSSSSVKSESPLVMDNWALSWIPRANGLCLIFKLVNWGLKK